MALQAAYDATRRVSEQALSTSTRSFVPPFLRVKANELEEWANTHEARDLLPVFLRILVNSTCGGLSLLDFPGHDDAQRPGWDGRVHTYEGNPWVPEGLSGWEFGTNRRISTKADQDYAQRTKDISEAERRQTAFVFVTPRRWHAKATWVRDRQAEGRWRTVLAWDASDLEQWLEQSISAQAWFGACRGRKMPGVKSLDRCWIEWCADCNPSITHDLFCEAISAFGKKVREHLGDSSGGLMRIVADSRQEGLAFLSALLSEKGDAVFRDRIVVFTQEGPLSELAVGSPGFIPVVTAPEIERELVQGGIDATGFVVEPRTAVQHESCLTLEPLSERAFAVALASMDLDVEQIERLDRASGRSLTVLRRRLARSDTIRSPEWSSDEELARMLIPMMLAGAWVADKDADRYLMVELAGCNSYEELERGFIRLLNLEDSPVWTVGGFRGVVSKVDALFGVHSWMSDDQIQRFVEVAEVVLSERDPALDLAKDKRWASVLYGKAREISAPLRKGVAETLVLLAIHGHRLVGERSGQDPESKVAELVRRLLDPLSPDGLLSQSSNLPLYAEAAPETFLKIFERDLSETGPVVTALMGPTSDVLFERSNRVDLLWALELLAWRPEWLARVVALLGILAELEPDDNLANKPSQSLRAIFRSWMPQTAAPVEQRIAVFDSLVREHPTIAWPIATSQFEPGPKHGDYSRKPRWRDYALGFGEQVTNGEGHAFVIHCVQTCLDWTSHTRETLADLMQSTERLGSDYLAQLTRVLAEWAARAEDRDRAWLRERIRVSARRTRRRMSHDKLPAEHAEKSALIARRAFELLEPANPVWKHWWLFQNDWVEESWDDLEKDIDLDLHTKRTRALRAEAVHEVLLASGHEGILRLALSGNGANAAGRSVAEAIPDEAHVWSSLPTRSKMGTFLHPRLTSSLLPGFFRASGKQTPSASWSCSCPRSAKKSASSSCACAPLKD